MMQHMLISEPLIQVSYPAGDVYVIGSCRDCGYRQPVGHKDPGARDGVIWDGAIEWFDVHHPGGGDCLWVIGSDATPDERAAWESHKSKLANAKPQTALGGA